MERPVSTIQPTTEQHAQQLYERETARKVDPGTAAGGSFIGELEGSMVPVVEPPPEAEDKRKGNVLSGQEGRLNRVPPHGSITPRLGGNFAGGVEDSGRQGWRGAAKAGFGRGSQLQAVGEGAPWIGNQRELPLGTQGGYWVEFFPGCEELGDAAKVGAPDHPQAGWEGPKDRLKANQVAAVLDPLAPFVRAAHDAAPVTAGDRYLRNRLQHLDSQAALQRGLPMGSGDIESAHRYLSQERLKRPGAGWSPAHLQTRWALG